MLVRKKKKWRWEKVQKEMFEKLKKAFITELVLVIPDLDKEIQVEVDVLDYAIEGVLSTKCRDRK